MKCLCLLGLIVLLFISGCASDSAKGQWEEFRKDLRGDNMKMRGESVM